MKLKNTLLDFSIRDVINHFRNKRKLERILQKRNEMIFDYMQNSIIRKLHIGCGPNILEGWLNTDLFNKDKVAYLDAANIYPLQSKSIDYIFSEHVF